MANTILIKSSGTANSIPVAGNLSLGELALNYADGNLFYKNSSNVVTVIASNKFLSVTGNVTAGNISGTSIVGTLTTAAQTNITSIGTLTSLAVTGNTTGGNILTGGLISATSTVTGSQFNGSGAGLTSIPGANVTGTVPSATTAGTVTTAAQGNITSVGTLTSLNVTGNITGGNLSGTSIVGTLTTAAQNNITSIGTLGSLSVSGNITGGNVLGGANVNATTHTGTTVSVSANITGGNLLTGGLISATANITGGNLSGTSIVGTLLTAAQTNITSVGTLGSLAVTGNIISSGNVGMSAVPGTNPNAALPVLFQTSAGIIDGGSGLTYNPAGDQLSVNGMTISSGTVSGAGSLATFTSANGAGQYDFRAANDSLRLIAGSSEAMRIISTGNVGIGTTTPVAKLAVVGGTTNASDLATAYSTAAVNITPKSTSGYSLAFGSGPDDRPYIQMSSAGTAPNDIMIQPYGGYVGIGITVNNVYDAVAAQRPLVVQRSDTSTTLNGSSAAIAIVNGDTTTNNTAQLNFAAITGASTNQYSSAIISAIFGARTNAQYPTGQLVFSTSSATNSAPTEKMRITSAGNVGIGTSSPSALLYVQSASTNALVINEILRNPNSGTGIAAIGFNVADTSEGDYTQAGIGLLRGVANGSGSLCFYNKGSGTASNFTTADEKMRIDSGGNVGIGTAAPTQKLMLGSGYIQTGQGVGGAGGVRFPYSSDAAGRTWRARSDITGYGDFGLEQSTTQTGDSYATQLLITQPGVLQFNSGYGSVATAYGCRVWCQYNGSATIIGAGNVSSITIITTGDVRLNFATALVDANYSAVATTNESGGGPKWCNSTQPTTTTIRIVTFNADQSKGWFEYNSVAVFR